MGAISRASASATPSLPAPENDGGLSALGLTRDRRGGVPVAQVLGVITVGDVPEIRELVRRFRTLLEPVLLHIGDEHPGPRPRAAGHGLILPYAREPAVPILQIHL